MIRYCFCIQYAELFHEYDLFLNFRIIFSIHVNGLYPHCDSTNILSNIYLFLKLIKFDNLVKTDSFLQTFLHKSKT